MAADLLQQLRDIHVPEAPGWWPPAPGWWLLGVLVAAGAVWAAWAARRAALRRRPLRQARRLYQDIRQRHSLGELSDREYLHASNELLKRLLIHGWGEDAARPLSGDAWLALLDRHLQAPEFSRGPGRALGEARFRPQLDADVEAVDALVLRLLKRAPPTPPEAAP